MEARSVLKFSLIYRYCSKIPSSPIIDICFQYLPIKKKLIITNSQIYQLKFIICDVLIFNVIWIILNSIFKFFYQSILCSNMNSYFSGSR